MNGIDLLSVFRTSRSEEAFAELVRRYTNLVYAAAHRRLSNPALAQEAAQIVFIRLAKAAPPLRGEASLVAWLHRTTMHVAIDIYAGGVPERHALRTDARGRADIPEPNREQDQGMNVFISAEFHVPICLNWHSRNPGQRTIKLDPALTIGGKVVDEDHQPVPDVAVEVQTPGIPGAGPEHVAFNGGNTEVKTDPAGRWRCPYLPRDFDSARLILTADGYAVTLVDVPVGNANSTSAVVIIKRGHTVLGRVLDSDQRPVIGASVTELHNWGHKRQATHSGDDGAFLLRGIWDPSGEGQATLVVQAKGLASQARTLQLRAPTNTINFILAEGKPLRGRVTDEAGNPIPNATVRTDSDNQGIRKYVWLDETDSEGRFEWDSAPEESVLMWFEAPGYQTIRDLPLSAADHDHEITLRR